MSVSKRAVVIGAGIALAVALLPQSGAGASTGDTQSGLVSGYTGQGPVQVAITPDGSKAYVLNEDNNSVSVVDTGTDSQITTVPGSIPAPEGIGFSPDGSKAYLSYGFNSLAVMDVATNTLTGTVQGFTGFASWNGVAFSPDGSKAYVASTAGDTVSVIDTATDMQTGVVAGYTGDHPRQVAFSPNGAKAYVANEDSNSVSVIDTATDTQTSVIASYTGGAARGVAFAPDGLKAYVAGANGVSVVDVATDTQASMIPGTTDTFKVAFTPDGTKAYVGNNAASPTVVSVATNTVTGPVSNYSGFRSRSLAFTPDGSKAYVADSGSNLVAVVAVEGTPATIAGISPTSGPVAGGTSVTITGAALQGTTGVGFGGVSGVNLQVNPSGTSLTVTTPPHAAGTVSVVVDNPGGNATAAGAFTFLGAPVTVTFQTVGGSQVAQENLNAGQRATKPADPTKPKFTFDGWFSAATGGSAWDFDTEVTADTTLYAHWTAASTPTPTPTPSAPTSTPSAGTPVGDGSSPAASTTSESLARTGSSNPTWLVWVSLGFVLFGGLLLFQRRLAPKR
ncbi:InlB B-repeat-containing protein [Leifsonia sp. NPDC102414]|uniref:InlB B-repeat-containing protein n=1 Tax=Leifsonia sp. NPDC102414 TaxID=3364124 RepID=UPI003813AF37